MNLQIIKFLILVFLSLAVFYSCKSVNFNKNTSIKKIEYKAKKDSRKIKNINRWYKLKYKIKNKSTK